MNIKTAKGQATILCLSLVLIACGAETDDASDTASNNPSDTTENDTTENETTGPLDITYEAYTSSDPDCAEHVGEFYSSDVIDVNNSDTFDGEVTIESGTTDCTLTSNGIPNHDFNDSDTGSFAHDVVETSYNVTLDRTPEAAVSVTQFKNGEDEGIMLNGVPIAILTSTCWDDDCEWRENPFYGPKSRSIDSNHAHSNSNGEYHYHGNPKDLYDSSGLTASAVVGYAADGFPIYGPYFVDSSTGNIREATSSYALQTGDRPGDGSEGSAGPGGTYTGEWREDYLYTQGSGDLDECNGMELNGQYAYYVTTTFPYLMSCFKGTPDDSFSESASDRSIRLNSTEHTHPHY